MAANGLLGKKAGRGFYIHEARKEQLSQARTGSDPFQIASEALEMALTRRRPGAGLIHHSDRGTQYACGLYRRLLEANGMVCSMSGRGDCYDNAVMESFFKTLKVELVYQQEERGGYATRDEARHSIFEYIEVFYNRRRLHSALGYASPEQYEAGLN